MAGEKYEFAQDTDGAGAEAASDGHYISEDELFKIKMIFWAYNIVDFAPF
jgi:hypothetical protein